MSRYYKRSDIVNGKYYKIPRYIELDFSDIKAKEIIIQEGDRLDIIAQVEYGKAEYWRAIALFNDYGYFFDLIPGNVLRLPYKIEDILDRI